MTAPPEIERLEKIERELARLRRDREALEGALAAPRRPEVDRSPAAATFSRELEAAQEARRRARHAQAAEFQRRYDEKLAETKPEVDRLQAEMAQLAEKRAELERKMAAALGKIDSEIQALHRRIGDLTGPPPMPKLKPPPEVVRVPGGAERYGLVEA